MGKSRTATAKRLEETRKYTDQAIDALFEVVTNKLVGWNYLTLNGRSRIKRAFEYLLDARDQLGEE